MAGPTDLLVSMTEKEMGTDDMDPGTAERKPDTAQREPAMTAADWAFKSSFISRFGTHLEPPP